MPFIEVKCHSCNASLVTVVKHKGTLQYINVTCDNCNAREIIDNDPKMLHNVGKCEGCGRFHNFVEHNFKVNDDKDKALTIDTDPIDNNDANDDMAEFIALGGQMDNEALADYDDCSNG